MGINARKPVPGFVNKGADQPAHPRSDQRLCYLLIEKYILTFNKRNSIFELVSVAGETCLSLALSENRSTGFVTTRPISYGSHLKILTSKVLSVLYMYRKIGSVPW